MAKNIEKTRERDADRAAIVHKVASTLGVSVRYVYMVISGERENDEIFATYMYLLEGQNALLEEVKKMVPFN